MGNFQKIFSKTFFPRAPGGDRYEWKEAETPFQVSKKGLFIIKIGARAKQNSGKDDDDLRMSLDGFDFGKYERHEEMISWKGFGTSASWDGATLKGGTKTIYFFVELDKGTHTLQFFADVTPVLKSIEVFKIENNAFELKNLVPPENIKRERKGIPWLSFVFLGTQTKTFTLAVNTKSAKTRKSTDGDNLKVIVNGKIQKNKYAPTSRKYGNFYFSGDIKEFDIFIITDEDLSQPLGFENAVELWYDEKPEIATLKIEYFDHDKFLECLKKFVDLKEYVLDRTHLALSWFRRTNNIYSARFLEHALENNPSPLIFQSNHPIVKKIKADPTYPKILNVLRKKLVASNLNGEIWPEEIPGEIVFESPDLATSLHGIRKIEYTVKAKRQGRFKMELILFDVYDFDRANLPNPVAHPFKWVKEMMNNAADIGERIAVVQNFEIEIHINETI